MEKTSLLLQELIKFGKLEDYAAELQDIIERIRQDDCEISTIYNDKCSRLEFSKIKSFKNRIRLSLADIRLHPLDLIWDLLHEFGHHQSGLKQDNDIELEREELAWKLAEIELAKYPRLAEEIESFNLRKASCLKTYHR